ncbi:MAG TPA: phosphoribosyltransferase family protein [Gemmatimonadaceae bacterium]|nr:phosphoribosyltransferase family protein [Gemmatimonadaceae bacterium]
MLFPDRVEAGRRLASELVRRLPGIRDEDPIVLAIPRGGVPVGYEVARAIEAPLDLFIARKLGAPGHEELGIGAVAPGGTRFLDAEAIRMLDVSDSYIEEVTRKELAELERRLRRFRGERPPPRIEGRAVILVDDGLATGVTALASLTALRLQRPRRLVFAAPVCSVEGAQAVARQADDIVCVAMPERFFGVGAWYVDFTQTPDEEVVELLARREAIAPR